ncbi:hypothetical protein GUJ93_ZPchr0006g45839 [Zizania palustris]|uniref:Uncharacterized protein n=1 Tax=Zizania palustris TaxID=103762 RepID=A0A8J5SLP9_ZIZPA|nr:hypothetical protein GUJ93_ZPchr0006g45839 [Zizania palustris]
MELEGSVSANTEEVQAAEMEASMPATAEVVAAKEVPNRVVAPSLGYPGDSGVEFLWMFEYTGSPVQSSTGADTSTFPLRSCL